MQARELREPGLGLVRSRIEGCVPADLGETGTVRHDHRAAERHRLQGRETEPLDEGRKGQAQGVLQQRREFGVGDPAQPCDRVGPGLQTCGAIDFLVPIANDGDPHADASQLVGQAEDQAQVLMRRRRAEHHDSVTPRDAARDRRMARRQADHVFVSVRDNDDRRPLADASKAKLIRGVGRHRRDRRRASSQDGEQHTLEDAERS